MANDGQYFPALTIREAECRALFELAEPTKDRLFPIVRLQAWPRQKVGAGNPVERSIIKFAEAFGARQFALDLSQPRTDLDTPWATEGRTRIAALRSPENGFAAWCDLLEGINLAIPTLLWSDDTTSLQVQAARLEAMQRGMLLRFRKSQGWNLTQLGTLGAGAITGPITAIIDYEQFQNEDLTLAALSVRNAILSIHSALASDQVSYVFIGSSFPSSFSDIHPTNAEMGMKERVVFDLLRQNPQLVAAGISLKYGDHASVYAADREPAFRGAPRVDYPLQRSWIYHRCSDGFDIAAQRVRNDPVWDDTILCWGAQRIRTAAGGNMDGLKSATPWTAIRINIHLHRQAHDEGPSSSIDEPWVD